MKAYPKQLLILSIFTLMVSCRVEPQYGSSENENIPHGEPVSVKINFSGVEWESKNNKNPQIYKNNLTEGSLNFNEIQNYTQPLDESSFVRIESIPETPENEEYLNSLGIDLKSSPAGYLPKGSKVLILAYKKNGETYKFHKQHIFEVGKKSDFRLNGGQNYTLIAFSTASDKLPKIGPTNSADLKNSYFIFDKSFRGGEYLYQRIDNLIPNGNIPNNKLDIRLKKRTTAVRVVLDASKIIGGHTGRKILSIKNAKLTYKILYRKKGEYEENNYIYCYNFGPTTIHNLKFIEKELNFTGTDQIKTSEFIEDFPYIGNNTNGNYDNIIFTAELEIEGFPKANIEYVLKGLEEKGQKKTYNLKFQSCGAYLGPNKTNYRLFMCCNLGTDCFDRIGNSDTSWNTTAGNRYAWGKKQIVYKKEDNPYESGNIWPESEIPTLADFENALKYNAVEKINDRNNNLVGYRVGSDLVLFYYTDYRTYIWTTDVINRDRVYTIVVRNTNEVKKFSDNKHYGQSVRCIKKLPN